MLNGLTYYDPITGRRRIKRRVTWSFWFFVAGFIVGLLVAQL